VAFSEYMNFSPKRPHSDFNFLHIFTILHQGIKNVEKRWKCFLWYSSTP
jgi:hypothetical protein